LCTTQFWFGLLVMSRPTKKRSNTKVEDEECVKEFKAFARGGAYSLDLLGRVWPNILREYKVDSDKLDTLLHKAGLYMRLGKIKSLRHEDPESP
jgi:hypothetical protein